MENVTDALYIAFAVLALVIALSVCMFAFNNVSVAADYLISIRDRETTYTYVDYDASSSKSRQVSVEDIIPTLYRAYKEEFLIRFEGIGDIYEIRNDNGEYEGTSIIDLESQSIGNQEDASNFIKALLSGENEYNDLTSNQRFSNFGEYLLSDSLYDILDSSSFRETLGVFYQEDRITNGEVSIDEGLDDVNKTQKRIITYTLE